MDGDHTTQGRWTGGQGDAMGHGMDAMGFPVPILAPSMFI